MPRWFWIAHRWFWILLGTFLLGSQLLAFVTIGLIKSGHHLNYWIVWAVMALSFALVYAFARSVRRTT